MLQTYPSYNLQPLLLRRQRELEEAQAFNAWLAEAVHRQVPQLRYARAERRGVERAAGEVASPCKKLVGDLLQPAQFFVKKRSSEKSEVLVT